MDKFIREYLKEVLEEFLKNKTLKNFLKKKTIVDFRTEFLESFLQESQYLLWKKSYEDLLGLGIFIQINKGTALEIIEIPGVFFRKSMEQYLKILTKNNIEVPK